MNNDNKAVINIVLPYKLSGNYLNPLMPCGPHILKQTWSFQLKVCLSMCDQLLLSSIKGLNDINLGSIETVFVCYSYTKSGTAFHAF